MRLDSACALALCRIGFGLYYLVMGFDKAFVRGWLTDGRPLAEQLQRAVGNAEGFYRPFLEQTVIPNAGLFAQLVTIGEVTAGICLTLGLLTRLGGLTGMWLALQYMLMKGMANTGGSIDRLFFLADLAFVLGAAGLVWGLDGHLRQVLGRNPITRWLAGLTPEDLTGDPAQLPLPPARRRETQPS